MIQYKLITSEQHKALRISDDGLFASSRFAGQDTVDFKLPNGKIKRITFGFHSVGNLVAITTEVLTDYREDYISKMLDQTNYENGWN